jgi:hypothetical protein
MYPKSAFYDEVETFASSLTHQVARAFADIPDIAAKFTFDKRLDRIPMQIRNSPETNVIFSADLLEFMGFPRQMIVLKELDQSRGVQTVRRQSRTQSDVCLLRRRVSR